MLERINEQNCTIFDELSQDYEEEFSRITGKKKNADGRYSVDVDWRSPNEGYYWRVDSSIVGFCTMDSIDGHFDIGEFYVIPAYRKNGTGREMAFALFNRHSGLWQVRQIQGAELAKKFWRRTIREYTNENYTELEMDDPTWGQVVCQRFISPKNLEGAT